MTGRTPTEPTPITPERLRELLDAYGAQPARWPEAERESAVALLARDAEAARMQREAADLDALLSVDAAVPVEVSPTLRARVAEIPIRHAQAQSAGADGEGLFGTTALGLRHAFTMLFSAAFVLGLGVVAGGAAAAADERAALAEVSEPTETAAVTPTTAPAQQSDASAESALQDDGWDALLASAFATDLAQEP